MARRRSATRYAILGMLNEGPMSGYDVKKKIENDLGHFWRESYGKIYPELKRLEEDGLATVRTENHDGRPSRKVYTITVTGMVELKKWVSILPDDPLNTSELLLKVYYGHQVSPANTASLIRRALDHVNDGLDEVREVRRKLRSSQSGDAEQVHRLATLSFRERYYEFLEAWCDESLESLEELSGPQASRKREVAPEGQ